MIHPLFKPKKIVLKPENLIIIPYNPVGKNCYKTPVNSYNIFNANIYEYQNHSILTGFLGYPHLFLLLECISDVFDKNVFFLGTAGCLNTTINYPEIFIVKKIYPSGIFIHFSNGSIYDLKPFKVSIVKKQPTNVSATSVDTIQRETIQWLMIQKSLQIDCVEMEIYPLREYLKKKFTALIVTSDLVEESGIQKFKNNKIKSKFEDAYLLILENI